MDTRVVFGWRQCGDDGRRGGCTAFLSAGGGGRRRVLACGLTTSVGSGNLFISSSRVAGTKLRGIEIPPTPSLFIPRPLTRHVLARQAMACGLVSLCAQLCIPPAGQQCLPSKRFLPLSTWTGLPWWTFPVVLLGLIDHSILGSRPCRMLLGRRTGIATCIVRNLKGCQSFGANVIGRQRQYSRGPMMWSRWHGRRWVVAVIQQRWCRGAAEGTYHCPEVLDRATIKKRKKKKKKKTPRLVKLNKHIKRK